MVWDAEGAEALSAERMLAEALEANRQLSELADGLIEDNALLREQVARLAARDAERDAELERLRADFAVLQRLLFGRSSERSRPEPPTAGAAGGGDSAGRDRERGRGAGRKRGPGARAGRRDYSQCAARRC